VSDDLASSRGKLTLLSGLSVMWLQDNNIATAFKDGYYEFAALADFLAGRSARLRVATPASQEDRGWRQWLFGFYAQSSLTAARGLTLNFGLRYEFVTALKEVHDRIQSLRDPLHDAALTLENPVYRNPSWGNFAPRFGFAWDPFGSGTTAVRGGVGLFYDPFLYPPLFPANHTVAPYVQRAFIRNPAFPRQPLPTTFPLSTQALVLSQFDAENPYAIHYTLSLQRQFFSNVVISLGYAGSRGVNLLRGGVVNRPVPSLVNGRKFFPAGAPLRNPNLGDVDIKRGDGNSWYNSFQLSAQKRFRYGPQFQVSYTFSRTMDEGSGIINTDVVTSIFDPQDVDDRRNERGLAAFHVKHNLVANYTWDVPFMRDREDWAGRVLGGWQLNGIVAVRTGLPFSVGVETDRARARLTTAGTLRPDLLPGATAGQAVLGPSGFRQTGRYYDPFVFTLPAPGFLGTAGRNIMIGPDLATFDFSLVKHHRVRFFGDNGSVQLRIEFFNLLNRANFSSPDPLVFTGTATAPNPACSPQFECPLPGAGRITGTVTDARQIQFALKITL
jgi:hypothetical protein